MLKKVNYLRSGGRKMVEDVLSFTDVMRILQIKKSTMYKIMSSSARIPFVEIGTRKIITRSKLNEWLHDNEGRKLY